MKEPGKSKLAINQSPGAKVMDQILNRYSNFLEIHLRYQQPADSTMCPLVNDGALRLSKYVCTHPVRWLQAMSIVYMLPIIALVGIALLAGIFQALHLPAGAVAAVKFVSVTTFLSPYCFPITIPFFYSLLFFVDLKLIWGKNARAALQGPTHISLSPLSIKLQWKGALLICIGAMFGWDEITFVELELPDDNSISVAPCVVITAKNGKVVHTVPIRLDGFQSDQDRLLFLHYIDNHVASECKTAQFKEYLSEEEQTIGDSIELSDELSAPGISLQTTNLAGLIEDKSVSEYNTSAERIIITPTETDALIPRSSSVSTIGSVELTMALDLPSEESR